MKQNHTFLPRFSSFAGLQGAADAADLAFVWPVELDELASASLLGDRRMAAVAGMTIVVLALVVGWLFA